jgi:hypothetical protein
MTNYEIQDIPESLPPELPDVHRTKEDVLHAIQERVWYMERVKQASLENTTENDWVLQGTRSGAVPYLQASGCEKIARLFGVQVSGVRAEKYYKEQDNPQGPKAYVWEYMGTFSLKASPGDSIQCPGSRASDDPFFSGQSRVDERDVKMAAYSNMIANGISRLLGLRNLTVEMLQDAGLDPGRMRGVEYRGERRAQPKPGKAASPSASSTDNHKKLYDLMVQIVGKDQSDLERFLEEITAFPDKDDPDKMVPGVRSLKDLKVRRCQVTLGKLRKDVDNGVYTLSFGTDGKPAA